MISGATEEELIIANDRADLLLKIRELENINDKLSSALNSAENKIDQLTNNWNELEEYCLNEQIPSDSVDYNEFIEIRNMAYEDILDKMKEIKGGNNE